MFKKVKKSNNNHKYFIGARAGAAVGAIAGILTAPKSGKETRKDIADTSKKAVKNVKNGVEAGAKEVEKFAKETGEKIKTLTDKKK